MRETTSISSSRGGRRRRPPHVTARRGAPTKPTKPPKHSELPGPQGDRLAWAPPQSEPAEPDKTCKTPTRPAVSRAFTGRWRSASAPAALAEVGGCLRQPFPWAPDPPPRRPRLALHGEQLLDMHHVRRHHVIFGARAYSSSEPDRQIERLRTRTTRQVTPSVRPRSAAIVRRRHSAAASPSRRARRGPSRRGQMPPRARTMRPGFQPRRGEEDPPALRR